MIHFQSKNAVFKCLRCSANGSLNGDVTGLNFPSYFFSFAEIAKLK